MLSLVTSFIKNKLFSISGTFFLIFAVIFSIFLFSNFNVILSKFGFETTTNLKAELTRTQEELKRLQSINEELNKQIEELSKTKEKEVITIIEYVEKKDITENKSQSIIKKKEEKIKNIIEQTSLKDNTENLEVIKLQNKLSEENITSLNEVFNEFFLSSKEIKE